MYVKASVFTLCLALTSLSTAFADDVEMAEETPSKENPVVLITTSRGAIKVELFADKAPKSVANFLQYVDESYYNGTIFHRVIDGFMVQGGGFSADMQKKPTNDPVINEADNGLKNERGTLALARTPDPNSATSQFFFNVVDNAFLDFKSKSPQGYGYCVFGRVTEGMDVVDAIKSAPTATKNGMQNVPTETIEIIEVKRDDAAAS